VPVEHRISAEDQAHADAEGAPDQLAVLPDLDAVGPAFLVQRDHARQQRVGKPARFTARPAFLRDPQERNVRGRLLTAAPQLFPGIPAEVNTPGLDHRPGIG
jgi:hypothetical protein